ncbi:hypothetical protein V6N12_047843 [Hibiscus sabdariffa]|uniref:LOB domain-containing protein n=1 Tax=Hibiscus sabdariffa TaxID=183260 RepID=A0ABR2CUX3_9ROSI
MRAADPVGGCYKYIFELNKQIARYQAELDLVNQQLSICKAQSMFTQYQQQQSAQKQKIASENDEEDRVNVVVDGQNSDGFNMFDSIRVDDQFSQYLNGVGSSSSPMYVHEVFDSIPVKVESETASNGIPSCKEQVLSDLGREMTPLFTDRRDEAFCFDSEGNAFSIVGEDIKPSFSFLDDKRDDQIYGWIENSNQVLFLVYLAFSSDKLVLKERAGGSVQHQLMHDLHGAASLFNFTNGKGIDK